MAYINACVLFFIGADEEILRHCEESIVEILAKEMSENQYIEMLRHSLQSKMVVPGLLMGLEM